MKKKKNKQTKNKNKKKKTENILDALKDKVPALSGSFEIKKKKKVCVRKIRAFL